MGFLKRLTGLFSAPALSGHKHLLNIAVVCNRCGEVIHAQINLNNDLSEVYAEGGGASTYFCRKLLVGKQHCFQPVEVELTFDANRKPTDRQIKGGKFIEA